MGALSSVSAPQLGAIAAKASLSQSQIENSAFDEAIIGNVLSAGLGQAPARQVVIHSGLPQSVRALTVNKVCGSGLKAVALAGERIQSKQAAVVLCGGIESMSQAPYYLSKLRTGNKMGSVDLVDGMIHDGLWDVYNQYHMGSAAELCAKTFQFSREAQDAFAAESYKRAWAAQEKGLFQQEIVPVEIKEKKETISIAKDEEPSRGKIENFPKLRPAFDAQGTVTAANASSINDGAAILVVGAEGVGSAAKPLARILHYTEFAQAPEWFTTAPVGAIQKLLKEASLKISGIAHFEINEAFSVVAMAAQKELEIPHEKLNPRGGAVAIGHPIGASGARLLTTLIYSLREGEKGVASLCIGGGEANAMVIERI